VQSFYALIKLYEFLSDVKPDETEEFGDFIGCNKCNTKGAKEV